MVRAATTKRNSSDAENAEGSPSPAKLSKIATASQRISKRKLLGEIPNPSSRQTKCVSGSSRSKSKYSRVIYEEKNDATKEKAKVAALLEKVIEKTQKAQPEKELADQIDEQTIQTEEVSGIIKSVRLFNFMCHESFYKEFHPNLNFITGENGSGKSAVLSGILVGLGARALTTARTKSIKSLVKTGKDFAKIEITLINRGVLDEDKYGETFKIERVIDSNGTSQYKLRSFGKARPLRKCELDYILRSLGILLDNPVAILNQETARSFLRSKNPKDKYKLFYEGTLLKSCDDLLTNSKENIDVAQENFERTKEIISAQQIEVSRLEGILQKINEANKMKEKICDMDLEYCWSKVAVMEESLTKQLKEFDAKNEKLRKYDEGVNTFLEERRKIESDNTPSRTLKETLNTDLRKNEALLENTRRQYTNLQKGLSENNASIRLNRSQESSLKKVVDHLAKMIDGIKKDYHDNAEQRKKRLAEKRLDLETKKASLSSEVNTLRGDGEQFKHGADACRYELNHLEDEFRQIQQQMANKRRDLSNLQQKNANKYAVFGREMEQLVAKIKANQNRFRKLPQGPFASCFTVKNSKWLPIIEFVLGNSTHSFAVDNSEDSTLLNRLISDVYGDGRRSLGSHSIRPNIHLGEFSNYEFDTSSGSATMRNHPTILDVLKFDRDSFIIKNALVDSKGLERVLLFENKLDALEILKNNQSPGFPKNCRFGFSLDFYKISPDPNFRADVMPKRQPRFLRSDTQNAARSLDEDLRNLETHCKDLRVKIEAKKKEESELRQEYSRREEKRLAVARTLHQINTELDTLSKTNTKGPDINNYMEEMHEKQVELEDIRTTINQAQEFIDQNQETLAVLASKKTDIEVEIQEIREKISSLETSKDKVKSKIDKINTQLQKIVTLKRQVEEEKDAAQKEIAHCECEVERRKSEAEAKGERVPTNRVPADIKAEIESYKTKISEAEKHLGNKKVVTKELNDAKRKYEAFQEEFMIWYRLFEMTKSLINTQDRQFKKSIYTITTSLQVIFKGLITTRGYKGTLSIDNENKELYYFICPDSDSSSRIAKVLSSNDAKEIKNFLVEYGLGLSGGECSFSTICFIISMWQVMQCPFFILDEFDVFMDAFNRKASQNALMSHARLFKNRQFFFLSPLELSELPEPGSAMVLRISPPKRTSNENGTNHVEDEEIADIEEPQPGPSSKRRRRK